MEDNIAVAPETTSELPQQEKLPPVPVEYQLQELYRRVRELEELVQRLTNHINREIGVAKDIPLWRTLEIYDGHFAKIKELTKLIS
jgi:hypothetical protein